MPRGHCHRVNGLICISGKGFFYHSYQPRPPSLLLSPNPPPPPPPATHEFPCLILQALDPELVLLLCEGATTKEPPILPWVVHVDPSISCTSSLVHMTLVSQRKAILICCVCDQQIRHTEKCQVSWHRKVRSLQIQTLKHLD